MHAPYLTWSPPVSLFQNARRKENRSPIERSGRIREQHMIAPELMHGLCGRRYTGGEKDIGVYVYKYLGAHACAWWLTDMLQTICVYTPTHHMHISISIHAAWKRPCPHARMQSTGNRQIAGIYAYIFITYLVVQRHVVEVFARGFPADMAVHLLDAVQLHRYAVRDHLANRYMRKYVIPSGGFDWVSIPLYIYICISSLPWR